MQMFQKGRSMIEMLGVLAIIGVLSIGGIAGYRIAVNKYQANVILDDVNRFAFTIIERSPLPDGVISPADFVQTTPYTMTATNDMGENYFYIDVAGVPKGVCHELVNKKSNDFEIYAGEEGMDLYQGDEDVCAGTNLMAFLFDTGEDFCQKDSDCGHCSHCVENRCQYGFTDRSGNNCYDCNLSDDPNDPNHYVDGVIWNVTEEECHRCKNRMYSNFSDDTRRGRCFKPLDQLTNFWVAIPSKEDCEKFPNHYWIRGNICLYCEGTLDLSTGVCSTTTCRRNSFSNQIYGLSESDCLSCGGEFEMGNLLEGKKIGKCWLPWSAITD